MAGRNLSDLIDTEPVATIFILLATVGRIVNYFDKEDPEYDHACKKDDGEIICLHF